MSTVPLSGSNLSSVDAVPQSVNTTVVQVVVHQPVYFSALRRVHPLIHLLQRCSTCGDCAHVVSCVNPTCTAKTCVRFGTSSTGCVALKAGVPFEEFKRVYKCINCHKDIIGGGPRPYKVCNTGANRRIDRPNWPAVAMYYLHFDDDCCFPSVSNMLLEAFGWTPYSGLSSLM